MSIKIENVEVYGWEASVRGMRSPMNSWHLSDTVYDSAVPIIGENDMKLMQKLANQGSVHGKYLRMITVTCDITSNHVWWGEFDTYKVGTVRNSCSKMHKIHVKEFVKDDFSTEGIDECGGRALHSFYVVLEELERLRKLFNETNAKKYWRAIIELLPMGYNIRATVQMNYEVLRGIYEYRRIHKMDEWVEFCKWIETLPYFKKIFQIDNNQYKTDYTVIPTKEYEMLLEKTKSV